MPIAKEIWLEQIRPGEAKSLVATFDLLDQPVDDPAGEGKPFSVPFNGIGTITFSFVCCLKGQAIYSATLSNQGFGQDQTPERAELLCSRLLRASL